MKLSKPLFDVPSTQKKAKAKKKRKKPRVTGIDNVLSGEFSDQSCDDDSVNLERAGWRLGSLHSGIHGRTMLVRCAVAEAASHLWVYNPGPSLRGALAAV